MAGVRLSYRSQAASAVFSLVALCPTLALAQPEPPPPTEAPAPPAAPAIVPPAPLSPPDVAYPAGAEGEATVLLELMIDAEGAVAEARVVEGGEPFAQAALAAARGFRFSPATRGGTPLRARVRFAITFRPPADEPAQPGVDGGGQSAGTPSQPRPAPQPPAPPDEVVVRGAPPPPGATSMTRAEVRQLPGAFGDPLRAIEALPGVTPIASGVPYFFVRGAPPGNIGYFLDGVRVPYLYHVGLGPSVLHPGIIDKVDLHSGGYPARYGRFAGGVVAAETTPPRPELHGEGNLRVFDAGALVEAPFADGRGTALVGGRYSYTALAVSLLAPEVQLDYRDYQARVSYQLGPRDTLTLFGFGAYDLVAEREDGVRKILFGAEFYRLDLRHDHRFGQGSNLRTGVTLGFDQTRIPDRRNARDRNVAARVELTHPIDPSLVLRAGADVAVDDYSIDFVGYTAPYDQDALRLREQLPPRTDLALGVRADVVWKPLPNVELVPGLRADLFRSAGASAIGLDPRVAATLGLSRSVRVVHTLGLAHQPPSFVAPVPALSTGGIRGGLQRSAQASAGVELDLPADVTASATIFKSIFFNMTDALGTGDREVDSSLLETPRRSLGTSHGLELFVRRRLTSRLGGFITYTLSRSLRSVGREKFPSSFDRSHVLNLALAYDLGRRWRAGGRFVFYTGFPREEDNPPIGPALRPLHPTRQEPFYRLDLRVEKRWQVTSSRWWALVFEVLNTTLNKEIIENEPIGPVTIPSVGVEMGF